MSISSSIVVGKSSGLYVKASYANYNQVLSWNPISKFDLISKCKHHTSLKGSKRNSFVVYANIIPGADSLPAGAVPPPSGSMKNWIIGIVLSLVLPFLTHKLGPIGLLKNKVDSAVQMVEDFVEGVEVVAGKVDKYAQGIVRDLPEGKLKHMMQAVEHFAEKTAKTADFMDGIIDKAQEAEKKEKCYLQAQIAICRPTSICSLNPRIYEY